MGEKYGGTNGLALANAIILSCALVGCAAVEPIRMPLSTTITEHRVEKSYEIGRQSQAFVGEQMLKVRDYYVTTRRSEASNAMLMPTVEVTMRIPPLMTLVKLSPNDAIRVVGQTERNQVWYRVVAIPAPAAASLRFLINADGTFEGSALNSAGHRMGWSYPTTPTTARLIAVDVKPDVEIDTSKGSINYELVYNGATRDAFQVVYREYTQNDLVRPAFSQTLVYEKGSTSVRFRKLNFEVQEASGERIRFKVLADGGDSQ